MLRVRRFGGEGLGFGGDSDIVVGEAAVWVEIVVMFMAGVVEDIVVMASELSSLLLLKIAAFASAHVGIVCLLFGGGGLDV